MTTDQTIQVKTYTAKDQARATAKYQEDANAMASSGYRPTMQTWVPASKLRIVVTPLILLIPGWLIAGVTGLVAAAFIGILYVAYASEKAVGTLTVTYSKGSP